jgi:hypothetical protein
MQQKVEGKGKSIKKVAVCGTGNLGIEFSIRKY